MEQAGSWNERGCFVLEDAFDAETLAGLLADFDPIEAQVTAFLRTRPGGRLFIADAEAITFSTHLVTRFASARRFCTSRVFQDLCHDLVGPDARLYWDQAVYKKPESSKTFPWHQDNGYTYVEPQAYLTCWVALTDATLESSLHASRADGPGCHFRGARFVESCRSPWRAAGDFRDDPLRPGRRGTPHATSRAPDRPHAAPRVWSSTNLR